MAPAALRTAAAASSQQKSPAKSCLPKAAAGQEAANRIDGGGALLANIGEMRIIIGVYRLSQSENGNEWMAQQRQAAGRVRCAGAVHRAPPVQPRPN
jgi:hypothetical protein